VKKSRAACQICLHPPQYSGLSIEQAKKLKHLEKENAQLKKLVADLLLDNTILKEVAEDELKSIWR
jgi:hypothetical protein